MREYSIGKRLVEGYLHQPYSWFLNRHSADLGKTILSEVQQVNRNGMKSLMELIAQGTVIIALTILLVLIDPKLATIVGFSLIGIYGFIFYFIRNYLNKIGIKRLENNELRFILVSEAFGAIKEIKVGGLEPKYLKLFSKAAQIFARTQASSQIVSQLPRFILEAIAFGGILLILLFLIAKSGSFNTALPVLSLYIFAGYRMMPALQQVYRSFTELTFVGPSLNKLYDELENLKFVDDNQHHDTISFNKQISLKNIYYNYPNTSRTALVDINLTIPAKSTIGIIGPTGSGKTTMVDIILGLLEPQKGTLEVDGKVISKNKSKFWQKTIGYVPQHIYLSDDSIAANIAFGKKHEGVNKDKIEKAAKIANLHDFVMDELPKQYQTEIGERGIRLSGGQRQRIGIARALYHNPQVLILDEATSSLDNQTEKAVMDAVNNLSENITIILIAHRLNTVKNCDIVFKLDKGQLQRQGTFEELLNLNEQFEDSAKKI
jgi:ABC-type bacteriocin/lantibiotic exporter with double-glycine peptidase domain